MPRPHSSSTECPALSRLRKKSVDAGSATIHWVRHVRNPLICRDRISSIEHVSCPFFPNRDFFRSLLEPGLSRALVNVYNVGDSKWGKHPQPPLDSISML
jgi:hypothetical protein